MFESTIQIAGVKDLAEAQMLENLGVDFIGFPLRLGYHKPDVSEDMARTIVGRVFAVVIVTAAFLWRQVTLTTLRWTVDLPGLLPITFDTTRPRPAQGPVRSFNACGVPKFARPSR